MSGIIEEYFDEALLAQASYANGLSPELLDIQIETLLTDVDAKMSASQAAQFVEKFEIIDHQANTDSGFSATVFQNKLGTNQVIIVSSSIKQDQISANIRLIT